MQNFTHYPLFVFILSFIALWLAALRGRLALRGPHKPDKELREDFGFILAAAQPNPITAPAVSGMNDALNAQGYAQARFWNRIPLSAWSLIGATTIGCNFLVGYGSRSVTAGFRLLPILPLLVSIALMFIADIDAPRHGIIRVKPQNLMSLTESLKPQSAPWTAGQAAMT